MLSITYYNRLSSKKTLTLINNRNTVRRSIGKSIFTVNEKMEGAMSMVVQER